MFFSDKSELTYLPFCSRQPHFTKAQIEWQGLVINALTGTDQPIVDLSSESAEDLLAHIYPSLSFVELCELKQATLGTPLSNLNWTDFFALQSMHFNSRIEELCSLINQTPLSFRDWCHNRKMSPQDLMPLLGLNSVETFNQASPAFTKLGVSRNEGKTIIDRLVDLILMDHSPESLTQVESSQQWLERLNQLRNPMTHARDSKTQIGTKLPKYARMDQQRHGDHMVNKIHVEFSDYNDLRQKLQRLSQNQEF